MSAVVAVTTSSSVQIFVGLILLGNKISVSESIHVVGRHCCHYFFVGANFCGFNFRRCCLLLKISFQRKFLSRSTVVLLN